MAYSKRLNVLSVLVSAVERFRVGDGEESQTGHSVRSDQVPRVWRVSDRLSAADVCSLVSGYCAGTTARDLTKQFNISKSSVKRLLRERHMTGQAVASESARLGLVQRHVALLGP